MLFPLITGIYVARVLLPESVGEVAYAQNIVQYFVILSYLGIPTYGMREVAKYRDDKEQLNRIYTELFIINLISTVIFFSIYMGMILAVPSFRENFLLFFVVGGLIALNTLNINWLFSGLEEFQFVSIRNIIFKGISFLLLIFLVNSSDDYLIYAAITVIGTAGNYIINIIYAPKFVHFTKEGLHLKRHMKPILYLVAVNLAIEIYMLIDVTMLGIMCEKTNVAYYSYGNKVYKILLQVVNSFTMVVVPRLSLFHKKGNIQDFNNLVTKTLTVIIILSVPMIVGIWCTADSVVYVMYGESYRSSGLVLKMLSFLLLISPIGYLLGSRMLLITKQEKKMLFSVAMGAIVNVCFNYFLIKSFAEYGAAAASVISGTVEMVIYFYLGRKCYKLGRFYKSAVKILVSSGIMAAVILLLSMIKINIMVSVFVQIGAGILVYFVALSLMKEETINKYNKKFIEKIFKRKRSGG